MSENNEKNIKKAEESQDASEEKKEELSVDQKLKETENKLLRSLAEIENQNLKLKAQLFSDSGQESFEYELTGREADASFIGKSVGEKLLDLAGEKFKKK